VPAAARTVVGRTWTLRMPPQTSDLTSGREGQLFMGFCLVRVPQFSSSCFTPDLFRVCYNSSKSMSGRMIQEDARTLLHAIFVCLTHGKNGRFFQIVVSWFIYEGI